MTLPVRQLKVELTFLSCCFSSVGIIARFIGLPPAFRAIY